MKFILCMISLLFLPRCHWQGNGGGDKVGDFRGVNFSKILEDSDLKKLGLNKKMGWYVGYNDAVLFSPAKYVPYGGKTLYFPPEKGVEFQGKQRKTQLFLDKNGNFHGVLIWVGLYIPELYEVIKAELENKYKSFKPPSPEEKKKFNQGLIGMLEETFANGQISLVIFRGLFGPEILIRYLSVEALESYQKNFGGKERRIKSLKDEL